MAQKSYNSKKKIWTFGFDDRKWKIDRTDHGHKNDLNFKKSGKLEAQNVLVDNYTAKLPLPCKLRTT